MKFALLPLLAVLLPLGSARADFALRDGDTVVFLGDSITGARGYSKIVEHYTLMRYPNRAVKFINAGQGGDTASGAVNRLERDVFAAGATVVTVAFGINDIGWGTKANAEAKAAYLEGIRTIVNRCQERKIRPVICSPAITAEAPDSAEKEFLQKMTDEGLALAKSLGADTVDLQRGMRAIQRRMLAANAEEKDPANHATLHSKDGIHLSDLGQLAMGYALLKGLGAPELVSSVTIDAGSLSLTKAEGCSVDRVKKLDDGVSFVRLDEGLPLNLGVLSGLNYRYVPVPEGINQYMLTVTGLPEGSYTISANGRALGVEKSSVLERGWNMAGVTANGWEPGGLWNAQSDSVKELVDARDKLWAGGVIRGKFMATHPDFEALNRESDDLDTRLTGFMRKAAKPVPYLIEIRRAVPEEKK